MHLQLTLLYLPIRTNIVEQNLSFTCFAQMKAACVHCILNVCLIKFFSFMCRMRLTIRLQQLTSHTNAWRSTAFKFENINALLNQELFDNLTAIMS